MSYSLTHAVRCAAKARGLCCLVAVCAALPLGAVAQKPAVEDLSGSSDSLYQQTETRSSGSLVMFNQVQEQQRRLQQLQGQVEELRHALEKLKRQSQQRYLDLDQRLAKAAQSSTAPDSDNDPASEAEAAGGDADSDVDGDSESAAAGQSDAAEGENDAGKADSAEAQKAYQAAFAHVQDREFDKAISAFQAFVSDYPNTGLTPNGYYWLGELYAAGDALEDADQAFTRVVDQHPESSKVPDAMYKLGLIKQRQGDDERGRELFEQVREDYPQSSAASLAKDELRR